MYVHSRFEQRGIEEEEEEEEDGGEGGKEKLYAKKLRLFV